MKAEAYVYKNPETGVLMVQMHCPRCGPLNHKAIRIPGERKRIVLDERGLFVDRFGCPWELDSHRAVSCVAPSANLCKAFFRIERSVIYDA